MAKARQIKSRLGFEGMRAERPRRSRSRIVPVLRSGANLDPDFFFKSFKLALGGKSLTRPYAEHAYFYAAVNAIARNIAGVPFQVMQGTRKDPTVVEKGPLVDLFDAPNPIMSRWQLFEATMIYLLTGGETLWVLEGKGEVRDEQEIPTEIWVHPRDRFKPVKEGQTIKAWEYLPQGQAKPIILELSQVIQFKLWNPFDPMRGLAPYDAVADEVRQDKKASEFNEAFFDNGGHVGGVLTSEQSISPKQRKEILEEHEQRHVGAAKRGRPAVFGHGLKYTPEDASHLDMQFIEQRKLSRDTILAALKVPKAELSLYEDVNNATAISQDRGFWQKTLIPYMRYIEDVLWQRLFKETTSGKNWGAFDLGVVEALQENFTEKLASAKVMFDMGYPVNIINERLQMGLPEVPWGDEGLVASNLVPAAAAADGQTLISGGPFGTPAPTGASAPESVARASAERLPMWRAYIEKVFSPHERRMMVKLKVYLGAQRRDVLNRLASVTKDFSAARRDLRPDQMEEILFAEAEWNEKLKDLVSPLYVDMANSSVSAVSHELGGLKTGFDVQDPNALKFLAEKKIKVTKVNGTVREALRQSLFEGLRAQETVSQIQDRIKSVYTLADSTSRRLRIARTETAQVLNGTRQLVYEAEGVTKQEWVTAGDENVRPSHVQQDGVQVEVGTKFPNGLEYPGDIKGPASEVVNCRCVAVAVVPKPTP